jgi:Family of unknown function (DUF6790)
LYLAAVFLLTIVLPLASLAVDHFLAHNSLPLAALLGKWFVFWGAGVRLFTAGLRQILQPEFTAKQIFHMTTDEALPLVREVGTGNIAIGTAGIISLWKPAFVLPIAVVAAIFYGIAGINHLRQKERSTNETVAMVTDLSVSLVLVVYIVLSA